MKVIPPDMSVELNCAGSYYFSDAFRALLGLPPLKWRQRLYAWLKWGRKLNKACIIAARGTSKDRLICKMQLGVDPFDLEDEDAEKES